MSKEYTPPSKETIKDWGRMFHVEIEERARHLWPDTWTITGYWLDEERAYKNAEYRWEKEQKARGDRHYALKYPQGRPILTDSEALMELANGDGYLEMWDDYFRWHVEAMYWCLHKDGKWSRGTIGGGIYNSYEEAVAVLAKNIKKAPRWEELPISKELNMTYEEYIESHIHEHNDPYGD